MSEHAAFIRRFWQTTETRDLWTAGTRVTTLESGETQGVYAVPAQSLPRLEKNTAVRIEKAPWPGVPRIWLLNVTKPPMDDVRVRRAIVDTGQAGDGHGLYVLRHLSVRLDHLQPGQHLDHVWFQSRPGRGSRLQFLLQ